MKKVKLAVSIKPLALSKIILIILMAYSLELTAQQDTLANDFLNKTTFSATDIVPFQITTGGNWYWRKITGANFWTQARDTTQDQIDDLLAASNSWDGINDFDGATFNAGSHGGVTFSDSLDWVTAYGQFLFPKSEAALSWIGSGTVPYDAVYSNSFVLMNASENDSVTITYNDSTVSFDKKIQASEVSVSGSFTIPDSATFDAIALSGGAWNPNTGDTVLTISSPESSILIRGTNSVAGWDSIDASSWAGNEQVIVVTNQRAFTTAIQDSYPSDGNIILGSDGAYSMGENGVIAFKYNSSIMAWVELYRNGL